MGEAFVENFDSRGEVGAAVCVAVDGEVVVDLWGGWADVAHMRPWEGDTLVNVFSVGKGLCALVAARLASLGELDVAAPVSRYWPEFSAGGKRDMSVAQLLSHQGGLPSVRDRLPPGAMLNHELMAGALAAQAPWWVPGTRHGYHANTFGFLVGELVRRLRGRTLGRFLAEEVTIPLGADVHIGLAPEHHGRVAEFAFPAVPPPEVEPDLAAADLMEFNAYWNPSGLSGAGVVNTATWRQAEIPSTNGHGTARGVARIYSALAAGGSLDGVEIVDRDVLAAFTSEAVYGDDAVLHRPSRFGLGCQLTQPERPLGSGSRAFGHFGAGGSLGYADPERGLAFGYVIGTMGPRWQNPRNRALIGAVTSSVAAT